MITIYGNNSCLNLGKLITALDGFHCSMFHLITITLKHLKIIADSNKLFGVWIG